MKKRVLYLVLPIITLILEILPYGAVCNFANPEGPPRRVTFSYFDLTPYGYANFAPLLTAITTCLIFVLLIIYCITGRPRLAFAAKICLCVCSLLSLGPLAYGIDNFSVVGALITVFLAAEAVLLHFTVKKNTAEQTE